MKLKVSGSGQWSGQTRFVLRAVDNGNGASKANANKSTAKNGNVTLPADVGKCVTAERDAAGKEVVHVSLGSSAKLSAQVLRCAAGAIVLWLRERQVTSAGIELPDVVAIDSADVVSAISEGLLLRDYVFDTHKSNAPKLPELDITLLTARKQPALTKRIATAKQICTGVHTARDLSHEPPNVINPVTLAKRVQAMAKKCNLKCTVFDERRLATMKAGGILGVGQGSVTPPRLITLEYNPRGKTAKPVVLVGKAITFDTGGYSIKTKDGMLGMKYDKCGGMAVIGAMQAVAAVKPNVPVVGVIASAENMIDGKAYRPDDIITTMSGKTVQIVSADAEGRMVLCDAMTYAQRKFKPRCMIDLATLTGGVVVALGNAAGAVFANDKQLEQALIEAGTRTHERLWPLPLWDEYFDLLKGDDSDFKNSGSRAAHAIQGGIFLKQFVENDTPWAHLDIAGVAKTDRDQPYCPMGATGYGVRLLLEYISGL